MLYLESQAIENFLFRSAQSIQDSTSMYFRIKYVEFSAENIALSNYQFLVIILIEFITI